MNEKPISLTRTFPIPINWKGLSFFVLVPLVLAALSATTAGYTRTFGFGGAFLYVSVLSIIPWWIGEGTTKAAWFCLRRFRPPLWLLCLIGVLLAAAFVGPFVSLVNSIFEAQIPPRDGTSNYWDGAGNPIGEGLVQLTRAAFFWIAANYIFDRWLNYPRFRYASSETENGLLQKLTKITCLNEIVVVEAEEHYVRVRSRTDDELVAYKFGQALADLASEDGYQVHRSYWVRRSEVDQVRQDEMRLKLELRDGSMIPVSQAHHALVRQLF